MIRVNDFEIEDNAVVAEMQYHNAETHTEAKNMAAESLIIAELIKQRARELGIEVDDLDTNEKSLNALIEKEVLVPEASESDCRTYFENNPEKFQTSPLVSGRHILLWAAADDAQARAEAREQANALIRELQGNIDQFAELAERFSRCPSAKTGGHLGQISKGQTVPEFERQLFNCGVGLVEAPIETRYGIHVVDIDQHIEGKPIPYEAARERIAEYLNEKVKRKAIAQYIATLIAGAKIEGFDMKVSKSPLMQ